MNGSLTTNRGFTGARRSIDVLDRLRNHPAEIWHRGTRVVDVTTDPALKNAVATLAGLYDYQWNAEDTMLERGPRGTMVNRSFGIPETPSDLVSLGDALQHSARYSMGMLGREPAYLNRAISSFSGSAALFGNSDFAYGENAVHYHAFIRENDLSLTHTLLNPRPERLVGPAFQIDTSVATHVCKERDDGIVIRGARLLATLPFADEIALFPARLMDNSDQSKPYAFGCALPTATPGLRFICRDSVDYGFGAVNHPLSARFEEMDAVAIFDDVFVPWERVFCYRDIEICNSAYMASGATAHMAYQVVCKNIVKTEFLLGLVCLMIEGSGLDRFQHVHEKMAEVWVNLETLKAFRHAAEAGSHNNTFGMLVPAWDPLDAARNLYPRLYPRMVEIVQQLGASGLVSMPSRIDLEGPLAADIKRYYEAARMDASDRIALYRLAWDTAVSAFGGRQILYERFFFGDPTQMASRLFREKDCSAAMDRVKAFLSRS
ncbi:4-hydroxyphenylacetate 3-monooxygenase, oxygenase component [Burkholderia multivorans]|uniref:4-hydroxyphenylacetate 3-monooxygenase, oxygenase component n=1 Tax=Burkholderia multivorans TaxID=87883 RepID=UPI00209CACB9|nr:4-hydroxyphenylacetate 3-monooxygenase, oxygenase component [Burkholderia multivorans]MCO8610283.1 4-hydroxyphenylacetate 3-monooxygenase, oxygenase component [Burkholderia multivorans]MCO8637882.1 4-hydroxyphenylacetate 3-monooxygenase, oxygenase component [Burkholderia multivorans]MCO8648329.1 4-hydroxyphenylacetate 3-monooxygenase, oxygenase component [Burkholderia multivorans]